MITVAIAEDQEMLRSAIVTLLGLEPDICVVAQLDSGHGVLEMVSETNPNVLVLDVEMPGSTGLDIAESLLAPDAPPMVVILTTFHRPGYLRRALEAGARAYLTKDLPVGEIAGAIRRVANGEMLITGDQLRAAMLHGSNPLSKREQDVLRAAQVCDTVGEIADHLHLSVSTVSNYVTAAISKTHSRNRVEAIRVARDRGWL